MSESKKMVVATDKAPRAIGPYSQAICVGQWVFLSGQIPLDPVTGNIVGTDIRTQTSQVLKNIEAVLAAAGCSLQDVVKTTVFLADLADFAAFNEVYTGCFRDSPPARSTVQAARLPKDVKVEIDAIAVRQ